MKMSFRCILKFIWQSYKFGAFFLGTVVFFIVTFGIMNSLLNNNVYWFIVPLNSGFIYEYDMQDGLKDGHNISDKNNNVVIYSDVKQFTESGKTIYGYRKDLNDKGFYFICDYGEDCSRSQNLTDVELRKIIKERGLPLYTSNSGTWRHDLKREIKRFYEKYGENQKPKWEYDKTWSRYIISGISRN